MKGDSVAVGRGGLGDGREAAELCGCVERSAPWANRRLEAIGAAIDWAPLAALSARLRPGRTGRPPYEPLVMLKALLLQRLYALSDPQLEEALFDRLSFRRFCGFAAG
ncbi:MAG: transposase, partial [Microvirga sp.]